MKTISLRKWLAPILTLGLICLPTASAEKPDKEYKLSQWRFGKVLFGEKFSKNDLKGKVVVIENWGVLCPPCVAAMPHLAELDDKHRDEGLFIIGAECQGHGKDEIKPILEKAKANFTITEAAEGPIEFSAIPRCHIFGRDGILVYDGSPTGAGFESALKEALAAGDSSDADLENEAANEPLIASREWSNSEGKAIIAAVKSADATSVVFILSNGKEVTYPLEKLSNDSREAIEAEVAKSADSE